MPAEERLDFAARFLQCLPRDFRVVPGAKTAGRLRPDEQPLLLGQIRQRELVRIQEASGDGAPQSVGVLGVGFLCHGQVASKRRLDRSQDVSAAATGAQEEDVHVTPVCF